MRRTTTALLVVAALALAGCSKSYDDTVNDCTAALKEQMAAGGEGKPDACKDVKEDDYMALVMSQTMDNEGWLDEDGNFDENKMLEDSLDEQP